MKITILPLAQRHFNNFTPYTRFLGYESDAIYYLERVLRKASLSLIKEVEIITISDPEEIDKYFMGTLVKVTPKTKLNARLVQRQAGENFYVEVTSPDEPEPLHHVDIVLYRRDVLAKENPSIIIEEDYGVASINGCILENEPQAPMSLSRNILGLPGGRKPKNPVAVETLANSVVFWGQYVLRKPEFPEIRNGEIPVIIDNYDESYGREEHRRGVLNIEKKTITVNSPLYYTTLLCGRVEDPDKSSAPIYDIGYWTWEDWSMPPEIYDLLKDIEPEIIDPAE